MSSIVISKVHLRGLVLDLLLTKIVFFNETFWVIINDPILYYSLFRRRLTRIHCVFSISSYLPCFADA